MAERIAKIERRTKETNISLEISLDGRGITEVKTGIPFFDHMLTAFSKHGLFDLKVYCEGDIEVDYHHTVEDVGIVLGEAIRKALGEKFGINRFGFFLLPMDEVLVRVSLDLSNRSYLEYLVQPVTYYIKDFNIALVKEFFQGLTNALGANIHIALEYGVEPHHIAEAIFKGFARALDQATRIDPRIKGDLPSTKGMI